MRVGASWVLGAGLILVAAFGVIARAQTSQATLLARAAQHSDRFQARFLIVIGDEHYRASMTVDFTPDDHLEVWVPLRMKESYQVLDLNGTLAERVDTEATYRNFRRFETSGRVVP